MSDNVEILILEQFRLLRNQIETIGSEMRDEFREIRHRFNRVELAVAGIRRDESGTAEEVAHQHSNSKSAQSLGFPRAGRCGLTVA